VTASLLNGDLRDLGEHRFKDLLAAERVYQLGSRDFPPLRSLGRTNLPVAAWPLLGRERELAEIRGLVAGGVRLLTLTGPGGSGKTRLALQAAAELSGESRDGTFFVPLAPLRETRQCGLPSPNQSGYKRTTTSPAGWRRDGCCSCSTTSSIWRESPPSSRAPRGRGRRARHLTHTAAPDRRARAARRASAGRSRSSRLVFRVASRSHW
jgi:hypothetical protein